MVIAAQQAMRSKARARKHEKNREVNQFELRGGKPPKRAINSCCGLPKNEVIVPD